MNKRMLIAIAMILVAVMHAYLSFWGRWWIFGGVLGWQFLATKEVCSYLFDREIKFLRGPGVSKDADKSIRRIACGFYFACYMVMFFKN